MAINCLSPISPSAFISRRVWVEAVTEANTIYASVCSTGTGYFTIGAALPIIETSYPCIPFPLTKGEKGLLVMITIHYHLI